MLQNVQHVMHVRMNRKVSPFSTNRKFQIRLLERAAFVAVLHFVLRRIHAAVVYATRTCAVSTVTKPAVRVARRSGGGGYDGATPDDQSLLIKSLTPQQIFDAVLIRVDQVPEVLEVGEILLAVNYDHGLIAHTAVSEGAVRRSSRRARPVRRRSGGRRRISFVKRVPTTHAPIGSSHRKNTPRS